MKKYVVLAAVLVLTSCTKKECAVQEVIVDSVAPILAKQLQCSNEAAIKVTLKEIGDKAGLCDATTTSTSTATTVMSAQTQSAGSFGCKLMGRLLLEQLANKTIPAEWGCTAANAKDKIKAEFDAACDKM